MSFFDGLIPTYTFYLKIERSDRTIIDTAIVAKAYPDEIAKAKKNIQRLLTEYTPDIKVKEQVPAPAPEVDTKALPEPEAQDPAADQQQDGPAEAAAPPEHHPGNGEKAGRGEGTASPPLPGVREHLRNLPARVPDRGALQVRSPDRPHRPACPVPLHLPLLPA